MSDKPKTCADCKVREVCKVRLHFLMAFGDDHIRSIAPDNNAYANITSGIRKLLATNCKCFMDGYVPRRSAKEKL